jgi:hypothetical protein
VLLTAIVGATIMLLVRRRQRQLRIWRQQTRSTVEAAHLAQGLLPASGQDIVDVEHWDSVRQQVEQAAGSLDHAAAGAPNQEAGRTTQNAAQALRDMVFALDSARLMRDASTDSGETQLADAEITTRTRKADLDRALERLDAIALMPSTPSPGAGPAHTSQA